MGRIRRSPRSGCAVRRALAGHPVDRAGRCVACSGGADSVALAAALAFEAPRAGRPAGLITVDHGLQPGSAEQAARVGALGYELGFDPVQVLRGRRSARRGGPEAAARTARYAALRRLADAGRAGAARAHRSTTRPRPCCSGLGRGSGPALDRRHAAGARAATCGRCSALRRCDTEAACARARPAGLAATRTTPTRASSGCGCGSEVLPLLEDVLQGGVAEALARTADLLQDDLDALDQLADRRWRRRRRPDGCVGVECATGATSRTASSAGC